MSFRLEMLQVARLAPDLLGEASPLVANFFRSQFQSDGGVRDRAGHSDLYYTLFGIEGLMALREDPPWDDVRRFLARFGDGQNLDFVHLCALLRCWSASGGADSAVREQLGNRVLTYATADGGFNQRPRAERCSAYGCLLGWSALGDAGFAMPDGTRLAHCLAALRAQDGGYANEPGLPFGSTTATAAAVALHRHLRVTPPGELGAWLLSQVSPEGGFKAFAMAPMPDLLSTAVALHALDGLQTDYRPYKEMCLDYIDTLWSAEGGFHGNWSDDVLDCEYTYYGLLALGHLSL